MVETKKRFREMLVTLHSSALSLFSNEERDTVYERFGWFWIIGLHHNLDVAQDLIACNIKYFLSPKLFQI